MRRNKLELYLHLVWTTWDRLPLIDPEWERRLHRFLARTAQESKCEVLAVNGMADHIHMIVKIPSTISLATLMHQLKGASSRFVNATLEPPIEFRWTGYYAAFSISPANLTHAIAYVNRQNEHHKSDNPAIKWEANFLGDTS